MQCFFVQVCGALNSKAGCGTWDLLGPFRTLPSSGKEDFLSWEQLQDLEEEHWKSPRLGRLKSLRFSGSGGRVWVFVLLWNCFHLFFTVFVYCLICLILECLFTGAIVFGFEGGYWTMFLFYRKCRCVVCGVVFFILRLFGRVWCLFFF